MNTIVIPVVDFALMNRCYDSMAPWLHDRVVIVDNTVTNRGVAASWNIGRDTALAHEHDYLTLMSEAVVFDTHGGVDWMLQLDKLAQLSHPPQMIDALGLGWKCVTLHRSVLEKVGRFDEVFFPAYYEDTDYLYRMHLAGFCSPRENDRDGRVFVHADATVPEGDGHANRAGIHVDFGTQRARYQAKWGGAQGAEEFDRPYDNPTLDWTYTGSPP